ncbi:MAG: hypothetical protein QW114_07915 [Candidatus Nezhaarchaeales archaeon]
MPVAFLDAATCLTGFTCTLTLVSLQAVGCFKHATPPLILLMVVGLILTPLEFVALIMLAKAWSELKP